jgi:aminoglycoside 6'-N-acetyltransferase
MASPVPDLDIRFTPVTAADYPMLRGWLESPHMREWWGNPDKELGQIRDKVEGRDPTRPFIFHVDGEPAGYIQYWLVGNEQKAERVAADHWVMRLPGDAVGVDLSIGDPKRLSPGIGTTVLRAFLTMLFDMGCQTIIIDPDEANHRAVRAYEKAGFVAYDRYEDVSGVTQLMRITPERFAETAG